jgi:hypothetical protein
LDIQNNGVGKMEISLRKPWITQEIINKMEERRKVKITTSKNIEDPIIN